MVRLADADHRWSQGWRLIASTGVVLGISVQVDEQAPKRIVLRVGNAVMADDAPAWLTADAAEEPGQRESFYSRIRSGVQAAIEREHTLAYSAR